VNLVEAVGERQRAFAGDVVGDDQRAKNFEIDERGEALWCTKLQHVEAVVAQVGCESGAEIAVAIKE